MLKLLIAALQLAKYNGASKVLNTKLKIGIADSGVHKYQKYMVITLMITGSK